MSRFANRSHLKKCLICGSTKIKPVNKELFVCRKCGAVSNFAWKPAGYDDNYFIDDYKKQYGRTYEQDFPQIYAVSQKRITRIKRIQKHTKDFISEKNSLLDIGCALGFFLKAAYDAGFVSVSGIEISAYAAAYAKEKFGFDVRCEPFEEAAEIATFDVISAWYFIEHCENTAEIAAKVYASLAPGGIFAFSAPSVFGPMFSCKRTEWVASRPNDHRVDFTPRSVKVLLKKAGFRKIRIYAAGFHPERLVNEGSLFYAVFSRLYGFFARFTAYSDTIEVYARK